MLGTCLLALALLPPTQADPPGAASPDGPAGGERALLLDEPDPRSGDPSPIINGEDAQAEDWPMTGAMLMDTTMVIQGYGSQDLRLFVCSSTLIAPDVVLLAAHCVDEDSFTYGYGTLQDTEIRWSRQADLSAHDGSTIAPWPEDAVTAWDWEFHPEWDLWGLDTGIGHSYDIALLFLEQPVLEVPFAYLPTTEEASQILEDNAVTVVGWGQQTSDYNPPQGTYGYKQMGSSFISELGDFEFQVGAQASDVRKCHGDSGGPSFMEFDTETVDPYRLVGVTSHAYDQSDCRQTGGVDTRVDAYLDWIDQELRERCADGTRAWCEEEGIPVAPLPEPVDTADTGDPDGEEEKRLCGCASRDGQAPAAALLGLLICGLALSRRRG